MQKIWFRKGEAAWYLTVRENGKQKQIRLIAAPNNKDGRKLAERQAIAELSTRKIDDDLPAAPSWMLVEHVLDGFLKHSQEDHEPKTYEWYKGFFDTFKPKYGSLRITQLKKQHIWAWMKARGFNATSQNRAIGALKRAFQWAVEEEYIPRNPIGHLRKPQSILRDRILTQDERDLILSNTPDQEFRDFVMGLSFTGCRPGELNRIAKEHVDVEARTWTLKKHKTAKKTGKPRVIYLCPAAVELSKQLIEVCPDDGPIFRNTRGEPWTINAVRLRFGKLRKKFPQLKGVIPYTSPLKVQLRFRKSFS
jgi:integrase